MPEEVQSICLNHLWNLFVRQLLPGGSESEN